MTAEVVVLVEDDPDDAFLTTHTLVRHGLKHEIVVVGDGRAALELLLPPPPIERVRAALVLLDLNLPHIGGFEVLRRLRADPQTADVPVILFTSTSTDEQRLIRLQPAVAFLRKPLNFSSFQSVSARIGLDLGLE